MEFRTLRRAEREHLLDLLDGWEIPDGWSGRDFFRRFIDLDPTYVDENVWVAVEGGTLLSCVQIFPRKLRVLGHAVPTGGIGSVFTREDRRTDGLGGELLERAAESMQARGMELSLLFAARLDFYGKRGWSSWKTEHVRVREARDAATESLPALAPDTAAEITPFDRARDFEAVRALHEAYSASRSGTVVRDDALWEASFHLAGNPDERFTVARGEGRLLAYLRVTQIYSQRIAAELARSTDGADALAGLVDDALAAATEGPKSATLVLPGFDDLELTLALERRGLAPKPIEDPTAMLRCLDAPALALRLGAPLRSGEAAAEYLRRVLPLGSFFFWPADRF